MKRFDVLRISLSALLLVLGINTSVAQTEFTPEYLAKTTKPEQRLGLTPSDSIKARNLFNNYAKAYKKADTTDSLNHWKDCHYAWKRLMEVAPFATHNLTNLSYGVKMFEKLLPQESDTIQRYVYFKNLMQLYDFRIQHLDQLNAIPRDNGDKRTPLDIGTAMIQKAHAYHTLGLDSAYAPGRNYSKEQAYQNFVAAFDTINARGVRKQTATEEDENWIHPYFLAEYFYTCRDLYMEDNEKYMEQFLTDYTNCLEACDKMMAAYKDTDTLKWGECAANRNNIQVFFGQTGAGNVDNLVAYFTPRVDSIKNNYPALKNAIHLMMQTEGMLSTDVYYKACRYSYALQPDFENCIGKAQEAKNVFEEREEALKYFNEADAHASTPGEHFVTSGQVGIALMSEPKPSAQSLKGEWEVMSTAEHNDLIRAWQSRQNVAARKLDEATEYGLKAGINGQNLAPYYLFKAQAYRRAEDSQTIGLASKALEQIKLVYSAYPKNKINDEEKNIENVKKALAENAARLEKFKADKRRYEIEIQRRKEIDIKRKAEEDFWLKK